MFLFILTSCGGEGCDDDSYYEYTALNLSIINPATGKNFFQNTNPDYSFSNFSITDSSGYSYALNPFELFRYDNDFSNTERVQSLHHPLTKQYLFHFNEYDQDTLKIIVRGAYTEDCYYEIMKYLKIYYNDKLIFYDLYPNFYHLDDAPILLYKKI